MQGVANALVMLGLLAEANAEAALIDHRRAIEDLGLELQGVRTGELTVLPGSAHGFAEASRRPEADLRELPLAFATPRTRLIMANGDLVIDCVLLTRAGLRGRIWMRNRDAADLPPWPQLIQDLSLTDDAGQSYRVQIGASGSILKRQSAQEALVRRLLGVTLRTEPALPGPVRWLDLPPRAPRA